MTAAKNYFTDPHALNMPWLDSPMSKQLLENANLMPREKRLCESYQRDGYVVIDSGLSPTALDNLVQNLAPLYEQPAQSNEGSYGTSTRLQDAWMTPNTDIRNGIRNIATCEPVLDALRLLYQREPVPFQTLNSAATCEDANY